MRATKLEFQLRMAINAAIIVLGLWAPWIDGWGFGKRIPVLEWLPLELSRLGLFSFTVASPVIIVVASLLAAIGAILRIWGTAYLGPATVHNVQMKAGAVMADGPYRYVRNPLYLGVWFMVAAMAFLMPPDRRAVFNVPAYRLSTSTYFRRRSFPLRPIGRALPSLSARRSAAHSMPAH